MCVWALYQIRHHGCRDICCQCACCTAPLAALILAPVGSLVGLCVGLAFVLMKWLPGSFSRCRSYCGAYTSVISAGAAEYDAESGGTQRQEPQQPQPLSLVEMIASNVEAQSRTVGSKFAAEVYCCCLPCFVITLFLLPVFVLIDLVCVALCKGTCGGFAAGCAGCTEFPNRLSRAIETLDVASSISAFGTHSPWCYAPKTQDQPQPPVQPNMQPEQQQQQQQPDIPVAHPVAYAY